MKKRVLFILVILTIILSSCTQKIEKGVVFVKNKSSYVVVFVIDYKLNKSTLNPGEEKKLTWVDKKLLVVSSPKNIVKIEENGDVITITNNDSLYEYTIINNSDFDLKITDNNESFLFDNTKNKQDKIEIIKTENIKIYSAVNITSNNFYLDKGNKITVNSKTYDEFEKIGNDYYHNTKTGASIIKKRLKIHINTTGNIIDIE